MKIRLPEQLEDIVKDFNVTKYLYDEVNFGNEILELSGNQMDVRVVQDRGTLRFDIKKTGAEAWIGLDQVWRFLTKTKERLSPEIARNVLVHKRENLIRALDELKGQVLEKFENEEKLLAMEELVTMGVIDRDHPLYKNALASVVKK